MTDTNVTSVGNDVVDLTEPQTCGKYRDRRFTDRILTDRERRLLADRKSDRFLWTLWSAKEAGFKAISKALKARPLARELCVTPEDNDSAEHCRGVVRWKTLTLPVCWRHNKDSIHCIALCDRAAGGRLSQGTMHAALRHSRDCVHRALSAREADSAHNEHSAAVRQLAKSLLRMHGQLAPEHVQVVRPRRNNVLGPPRFETNGQPLRSWDLSLSHHGNFVGAAIARCARINGDPS